jgi:hypothetical protein
VLAAALALSGCGHVATNNAAVPSASPDMKTYTSKQYHFAVSYDASKLAARIDQDISTPGQWLLPGVGHISGPTQVLYVGLKSPTSLSEPARCEFQLLVVGPVRQAHPPTLAEFSNESYLRRVARGGWLASRLQAVKLDGLPAFRYSMRVTPSAFKGVGIAPSPNPAFESITSVNYVVYRGGFVYSIALEAPTSRWPSVEPALNAVVQSFAVAP